VHIFARRSHRVYIFFAKRPGDKTVCRRLNAGPGLAAISLAVFLPTAGIALECKRRRNEEKEGRR